MAALRSAPEQQKIYVSRNDNLAAGPPNGVNKNLIIESPKKRRYLLQSIRIVF
jgi:hypothetical protein